MSFVSRRRHPEHRSSTCVSDKVMPTYPEDHTLGTHVEDNLLATKRRPHNSFSSHHLASTDNLTRTSNETIRQTKPGLVALYDIRPGIGEGLFLQPRSPHGAISSQEMEWVYSFINRAPKGAGFRKGIQPNHHPCTNKVPRYIWPRVSRHKFWHSNNGSVGCTRNAKQQT